MADWKPSFKLFQADGTTLVYTFLYVQKDSGPFPHTEKHIIEHENPRAKGSLVIDGGLKAYDLTIHFFLKGANYTALMALIDTLESAIPINYPGVLKIDKSSIATYDCNVKRLLAIERVPNGNITNVVELKLTFRCNSW